MDATGFKRDEIQPDMDLRRDLSIRSSRLPIIMDAAERQFGITIELEDFIDVRTVKDIAQRISEIIARQEGAGLQPATQAADPGPERDEIRKPAQDEASLKRLVFSHVPVEPAASIPMELSPGESVLLLSPDQDDGIGRKRGRHPPAGLRGRHVSHAVHAGGPGAGRRGLRHPDGRRVRQGCREIAGLASLAGMVITLPQGGSGRLEQHGGCVAASQGALSPS